MSKRIFVANWKMQLSFDQEVSFAKQQYDDLAKLAHNDTVVLCPSFTALHSLAQQFKNSTVHIGAQTVSRHPSGAYTGQVSAQSLKEAGCTYCIIGHSERRNYCHETNVDIAHKLKELLKQQIIPIICIGETKEQHEQQQTYEILEQQLEGVLQVIADDHHEIEQYCIAYEPVWAIGTGIIPTTQELAHIFAWLHEQCSAQTQTSVNLLYGGSVNPDNAHAILKIAHVNGLLIGGASLDIHKLKTIMQPHRA